MTAPSLLDDLEEVVRLTDAASFVDLDWDWRRDDDDTPGSIFTHSFGGMHQAVAMCPRYGKDSFAADASYIVALHNFLRTHHAEIADMAKRLEAADRDARGEREETWEIWEYGMCVAGADDLSDAQHYLTMYGQDGPVKLVRVISYRETVTPDAIAAAKQEGEE